MGIKSGKFEIRKWAIRYYMLKKLIWNIELKKILQENVLKLLMHTILRLTNQTNCKISKCNHFFEFDCKFSRSSHKLLTTIFTISPKNLPTTNFRIISKFYTLNKLLPLFVQFRSPSMTQKNTGTRQNGVWP